MNLIEDIQHNIADKDHSTRQLVDYLDELDEKVLTDLLLHNKYAVKALEHFWPDRNRKRLILALCFAILKTYEEEERYKENEEHKDYHHKLDSIHEETSDSESHASLDIGGGYKITRGKDGSDTVSYHEEALVKASTHANLIHGKHGDVGITASAQAGEDAYGSASTSDHGASAKEGVFLGDAATVSVNGDVKYAGVNAHVTDGVTFGDEVGASASGSIDWGHSKLTISAGGKLVAGLGIHGKIKISIDTKPITEDYDDVKHDFEKWF